MTLARRKRGCAKNAGRASGGGTLPKFNGFIQPGRVRVCVGMGSPLFRAALNLSTPQPAGETAPAPQMKIRFTTTSEK
jgi:hypothetical protein